MNADKNYTNPADANPADANPAGVSSTNASVTNVGSVEEVREYHREISGMFAFLGRCLWIALAAVVVLSLVFGHGEFKNNNLYYFFRDFGNVIGSEKFEADAIDYGAFPDPVRETYRGGIAVASGFGADLYSATGKKTVSFEGRFSKPAIRTSKKYVLVFDEGGNGLSVGNSFMRLYNEEFNDRIYDARVNDKGDFIVLTKAPEYKSLVYLYDGNFRKNAAYYFTDFVVSAAISQNGKYILALTLGAEDLSFTSVLKLYKRGEKTPAREFPISGEMPLSAGFAGKKIFLVTDGFIRILDLNCREIGKFEIPESAKLERFAADDEGAVVSYVDEGKYVLLYMKGKDARKATFDAKPAAFKIRKGKCFLLFENKATRYDFDTGKSVAAECPPHPSDILVVSDDVVYLCYATKAIHLEFED